MSNQVRVNYNADVDITPELLAKAFWNMDTRQQTEFFKALAIETKKSEEEAKNHKNWFVGQYGEMQWCRLRDELQKDKEAWSQYQALSTWAFDFLPLVYKSF